MTKIQLLLLYVNSWNLVFYKKGRKNCESLCYLLFRHPITVNKYSLINVLSTVCMSVLCRMCHVFLPLVSIFGLFPVLTECDY